MQLDAIMLFWGYWIMYATVAVVILLVVFTRLSLHLIY